MSHVRILLLGSPRVLLAGKAVNIRRRKALALLAYLAVTRRRHSRDALATLFWPEADAGRAYANLRQLLWVLGEHGLEPCLEAGHEDVGLHAERGPWVDVAEFRGLLADARERGDRGRELAPDRASLLSRAVTLYRDHFLSGFALADNLAFDDWQTREQEALQGELADALARLVRHHAHRGELDHAVAHAERAHALDPLDEPAQRMLMEIYARSGRRSAALHLYDRAVRMTERDLGLQPSPETTRLRDRILAEGRAGEKEAPTQHPPRTNLPSSTTPFIGREPEIAEIRRLLADPAARLVTLVGPGGTGKTRLALRVAETETRSFADGVFLASLAAVRGADHLAAAVAGSLGAPFLARGLRGPDASHVRPGGARAHLVDYLRPKQLLLVLDNVEHLVPDLGAVDAILEAASGVKILATSRVRLRLGGEWAVDVGGLPFPVSGTDTPRPAGTEAVRLFVRSARRARTGFKARRGDLPAIARVCRRVEGNPLAIELAAAWAKLLPVGEIAARIEADLDFLAASGRSVLDRHRSLRAVFEQSWDLLSREERSCFRRLTVLRGEFSLETAEAVGRAPVPVLGALVDKSFLRRNRAGRFEVHEVLRQYGGEKLAKSPAERARTWRRFSAHYVDRLARLEKALQGPGQADALEALAREAENVRAAWLLAAEGGRVRDLRSAFRSLFLFHDIRNRFEEGAETCAETVRLLRARGERTDPVILGSILAAEGWFAGQVKPVRGRMLLRRALRVLESCTPGKEAALARNLATIVGAWPHRTDIYAKLAENLTMCESSGDAWGAALTLEVLALALHRSDPDRALRCAERSLRIRRSMGDRWSVALAEYVLGRLADLRGLPHVARKRFEESLKLRRRLGQDPAGTILCLIGLWRVARGLGEFEEALRLSEESVRYARAMGNRLLIAEGLTRVAIAADDMGDPVCARRHVDEALPLFEELGESSGVDILRSFAGNVAFLAGDREEARFLVDRCLPVAALPRAPRHSQDTDLVQRPFNPWHPLLLGRLAAAGADARKAGSHLALALRLAWEDRDEPLALEALLEIGALRLALGEGEGAAEIVGYVSDRAALGPRRRGRAESLLAELEGALPADALRDALARGRTKDPGRLVPEASAGGGYGAGARRSAEG